MEIYIKLFEVLFPVFFIVGVGYFIGKIMKVSGGKINHKKIIEVLNKELKKK